MTKVGNKSNKTALIVAYHFPPAAGQGLPGTQRAVKLIRYLPERGWNTTVLTVKASAYPDYIEVDMDSVKALPPQILVERTGAISALERLLAFKKALGRAFSLSIRREPAKKKPYYVEGKKRRSQVVKDSITELFEIPDEVSGWILPAVSRGRSIIRKNQVDAIITTGRPWSSLVIGSILSKMTGLPLISDFRDPWMTNPFRADHSRLKNKADNWLEQKVIRRSRLVVANTDLLKEEFIERYPDLPRERFICVPNGFDAQDIQTVLEVPEPAEVSGDFVLVHAGFLYGKRNPRILVDALKLLTETGKVAAGDLKVRLVGPRDLPYSLKQYVSEQKLTAVVQIIDAVPYSESLRMVAASSAAILLQPDTLTQVPSKLFENIGLGKKTVAIADRDSATSRLFEDHDLGFFADCGSVEEVAEAIHKAYRAWQESGGALLLSDDVKSEFDIRTSIREIAVRLDGLMDAPRDPVT